MRSKRKKSAPVCFSRAKTGDNSVQPIFLDSYVLVIRRAMRLVVRRLEKYTSSSGIQLQHIWVLMACRHGDCSQKQAAEAIFLRQSEMTPVVDAMVSKGLIRRRRNPHDRREYLLHPTPAGRKVLQWVDEHFKEGSLYAFRPLTIAQLDQVRDLLLTIIQSESEGEG